jgi:HK97 family phage portal protein
MSRPSGVLSAPGVISAETANRIKEDWQTNFSGNNVGKTAVLGDGINYLPMTMPAEQAQLIEQLKWTTTDVARCFHVPMFKLGDPLPHGSSIQAMNLIYWTDCLQVLIESAELCLTEGLGLTSIGYEVEFDLDGLLRMDTVAQVDVLNKAVAGGWMSPDEARQRQNMAPVAGGATPYMQQQNYSLAALAKRDAQADPFANVKPAANEPPPPPAAKSKSTKDFDYVASFGEQIINQLKDLRAA